MSYVSRTLSKDEEIKEKFELHWINYVYPVFLAIMLLLATIVVLATSDSQNNSESLVTFVVLWLIILYYFLQLWSIEMIVTNKRVVYKKGIIATDTEELKNAKIESVEIKQGILDRILGTGSIHFSGTGTSKVKFNSIDNPWKVKSRIEEYIGD